MWKGGSSVAFQEEKDRRMLEDGLAAQNYVTGSYGSCANLCLSAQVKMTLLNLLGEEHRIQGDLLGELSRRGWKTQQPAPKEQLEATRKWITQQRGQMQK